MNQRQRDMLNGSAFIVGFVLGLLLFSQCSCAPVRPPAICETACGMRLVSPPPPRAIYDGGSLTYSTALLPWWTCDNFNAIESQSLQALHANASPFDDRFELHAACDALDGVTVTVRPERAWYDDCDAGHGCNNEWVAGLTDCFRGEPRIQVGNREPADGTLTHEMAHAIQRCEAKGPAPHPGEDPDYAGDSDPGHLNWTRFGVYAAESQVMLIDVAERMRRDQAVAACDGGIACANAWDAGSIP